MTKGAEHDRTDADDLRAKLIRNVDAVTLERQQRSPLYDTRCAGFDPSVRRLCQEIRPVQRGAASLDYWDGEA